MDKNHHTIAIPQDKPYYKKAFVLIFLLDAEIKKVKLQTNRIELEKKDLEMMNELFADIHFLFITFGNLKKLIQELGKLFETDTLYKKICNKYLPELDKIGIVRNHLEHIEERIMGTAKGKKLIEPNMFGNLFGDVYNFGGDKVDLADAFKMACNLETDLKLWNTQTQINPFWLK